MLNLGDTFTYSIWARLSDEETKTNIKAQITAGGTLNGQNSNFINTRNSMGGDSIISKTWKRFYYTFTVPAERLSENNGSITLTRFEQNISSSDNCYVMWAAPKLERGSKPTDWSPAPEDVDIDEIEIGGRNYLLNSSKYREDKPWTINNTTANDSIIADHTLRIYFEQNQEYIIQVKSDGDVANSHGYKTDNIGKFTLWFYERYIDSEKDEHNYDFPRCFYKLVNNNTQKYLGNKGNTYYWYYKCPSNVRDACIRMNTYADTENPVTIHFWDLKIEKGNKPTDWTPAPEDIENDLIKESSNLSGMITGLDEELSGQISGIFEDINGENGIKQKYDAAVNLLTESLKNKISSEGASQAAAAILDAFKNNEYNTITETLKGLTTTLTTNKNGYQIMSQNDEGFQFEMGSLIDSVSKWDTTSAYVHITTLNDGSPAIILGAYKSDFRIRITNKAIDFMKRKTGMDGSLDDHYEVVAYANHTAFYNTTAIIEEEIRIMSDTNGFIWRTRANGNLGLSWFVNQTETEG